MLLSVAIGCCDCVLLCVMLLCAATAWCYCARLLRAAIGCCCCSLLLPVAAPCCCTLVLLPGAAPYCYALPLLLGAAPCCCSLLLLPVAALQTVSVGGFSERLFMKNAIFSANTLAGHSYFSFPPPPPAAPPAAPPASSSLPGRPIDIRGVKCRGPLTGFPRKIPGNFLTSRRARIRGITGATVCSDWAATVCC